MDFNQLIDSITPETYEKLKRAVETGKWPDGVPLRADQKEQCLQAVIAYDARNKDEPDRVGFIHTKKNKTQCASKSGLPEEETKPLKWDS